MRHAGGTGAGPDYAASFVGLTSYPPVSGEPGGRAYVSFLPGDYRDVPRLVVVPATHSCEHDYIFFPFTTYFSDDPSEGPLSIGGGFADLRTGVYPRFTTPENQHTLNEIIVQPDYVQVYVMFSVETTGGNNGCPPTPTPNLLFTFPLPPVDTDLSFSIDTSFGGQFPWGLVEDSSSSFVAIDQTVTVPGNTFDVGPNGWLRRPIDGDTYVETGDFTFTPNDAVDTLFPWDEFVALTPSVDFNCDASAVNSIRLVSSTVVVRPYWIVPDNSIPTSLVLEAGPGGWRRRARVFGSQTPRITVG